MKKSPNQDTKNFIMEMYDNVCAVCKGKKKYNIRAFNKWNEMHIFGVYHIFPKKTGGNKKDNLIYSCPACYQKIKLHPELFYREHNKNLSTPF